MKMTAMFDGFKAELTKISGYTADSAKGEGAGKPKATAAGASPVPPGGTPSPAPKKTEEVKQPRDGAAFRADPDDDEGYE
jgi:hypothetical protein